MTLENIFFSAGGLLLGVFGTLWGARREFVTKQECQACRQSDKKENDGLASEIKALREDIIHLNDKYSSILKTIILNLNLPTEIKQQILP